MKHTATLVIILVPMTLGAQTQFQRLYSGDLQLYGHGIAQRSDGGYASCGEWQKPLGTDAYLLLTDVAGNFESMTRYTIVNGSLGFNDIEQTSDGGYVMCGFIDTGTLVYHGLIVQTNSSGTITWSQVVGGGITDDFKDVVITSDGGYFVAGITQSYGNGGSDALAVKFDATGTIEWAKAAGTGGQDASYGALQTTDDGYALAGRSYSVITPVVGGLPRSNNDNLFMLRLDEAGNRMWGRATGGYLSDAGDDVMLLGDGHLVFSGTSEDPGGSGYNAMLVGVNPDGTHWWTKTYDFDSSYNHAYNMAYNGTEIAVIGSTDKDSADGASSTNPMLLKTNETGDLQWCWMYGVPIDPDEFYDIAQTSDQGYIMTGYSAGFGTLHSDTYVVKTDNNGVSGCHGQPVALTVVDTALDYGHIGDSVIDIPSIHHFNYTLGEEPYAPWDSVLCLIAAVPVVERDDMIRVFPNPAHDEVTITLPSQALVEVLDLAGRLVSTHSASSTVQVNISEWPTGIYLLKVITEGHVVGVRKLIVE